MNKQLNGPPLCHALALVALMIPGGALASGFQTSHHSAASFSRALGGAGLQGDDLADIYYNPAGTRLYGEGQVQAYYAQGKFTSEFTDTGSTRTLGGVSMPASGAAESVDQTVRGASIQWVPRWGDNERLNWALVAGNAFGNRNRYDSTWLGRYHAVKSKLIAPEVGATVGYAISDSLSTGFGVSVQNLEGELSQATFTGMGADAITTLEGDSTAFGFNVGLIKEIGRHRLGVSYRSSMDHTLEGDSTTEAPGLMVRTGVEVDLTLPETVYLSGRHDLQDNGKWVLSWSARWTRWSRYEELRVQDRTSGSTLSLLPQNWNDVWLLGVGLDYAINESYKLRFGVARDQTPIPSAEARTPRLPEDDRTWLSIGLSWAAKNGLVFDVGYQRQIIEDTTINSTVPLVSGSPSSTFGDNLRGDYDDGVVDAIGLQLRWDY